MTGAAGGSALRLRAVLLSAAAATAIGGCADGSGTETARPAASSGDPSLARCSGGRATAVVDPAGDVLVKRVRGKRRTATRPPHPARSRVDIRAASVKVRHGLLCITLRIAADLTQSDDGSPSFTFKLANHGRGDPPIPPAGLAIFATGVQWFGPGAVQAEETPLAHAYLRDGNVIRAAVRVDAAHPAGIAAKGQRLSFTSFQWRLQSSDPGDDPAGPFYFDIDCAPDTAWVSYPSGARVGDPPYADENVARCRSGAR